MADTSANNVNLPTNSEYVNPTFRVHKFSDELAEKKITFHVLKMVDSFMIFVNESDNMSLTDMSFSVPTKYISSLVIRLFGSSTDLTSRRLALKMSKKLQKRVFMSFNVNFDDKLVKLIEMRLNQEIEAKPDIFSNRNKSDSCT